MEHRPRVVVALHDPAECTAVADWLTDKGCEPLPRVGPRGALGAMDEQGFDLLISDADQVALAGLDKGERALNTRIPVILVGDTQERPKGLRADAQAMYLTRPLDRATLMCYVWMAILDHRPERRSIRRPVNNINAFVNGLPVSIVDVSNEGLCLVTPPDRSAMLPPSFSVRVPAVGVTLTVQRVWGRRAKLGASTTWYGGALAQNPLAAEQGWRTFVDTVPLVAGSSRSVHDSQ